MANAFRHCGPLNEMGINQMTFTLYKNARMFRFLGTYGIFSGTALAESVLWQVRKDDPENEYIVKIDRRFIIK